MTSKDWKEKNADADACLKRCFMIKPEFNKPGNIIQTTDGTKYVIAKDGS